jgi:hypothetical protein
MRNFARDEARAESQVFPFAGHDVLFRTSRLRKRCQRSLGIQHLVAAIQRGCEFGRHFRGPAPTKEPIIKPSIGQCGTTSRLVQGAFPCADDY